MSNRCPLPIDWLDYLEGDRPEGVESHLHACPSCREALSLLEQQPGRVPSEDWAVGLAHLNAARLVEETAAAPAPAELWFSAGEWTFHDAEYRPPERSLVLVLSGSLQEDHDLSWYDVAPVRTDVEEALPTDFLLGEEESSFGSPLRLVLSFECKVERRQLESKVGALIDFDRVLMALGDKAEVRRWGNPLESAEDPRLHWETDFSATMEALRGPWLQHLEEAERVEEELSSKSDEIFFVPLEWQAQTPEPALAAAASETETERHWELMTQTLELRGRFAVDWDAGSLVFLIHRFRASDAMRLRLNVYVAGDDHPHASEVFEPAEDKQVSWGKAFVPDEIEKLGATVIE